MSIWVTGANGFIGRHLVRELCDSGQSVHGVGHGALDASDARSLGLQSWINGDVDSANLNALAVAHGLPSRVFHLAGGSSVGLSIERPFEDFSRTVASTARLLDWLRSFAPKCLLIVASSAAVYGADHVGPISEDATLAPMSPYGQHKFMMEQLCQSYARTYGIRSLVVRLFSVYGPHLRKQLLWDICSRLRSEPRSLNLAGTGAEIRDWTDVRDVVRLLAHAETLLPVENFCVVNGGSGKGTTVSAIVAGLVRLWGSSAAVHYSGVARPGDPTSLLAYNGGLREIDFCWQIPIERSLADYVDWFRDQARG